MYGKVGRLVENAHRGFALVHILAARASGAGELYFEIIRLELDFITRNECRKHLDESEARLPLRIRVEGRLAHEPMHARFVFEPAVHARTSDLEHHVPI